MSVTATDLHVAAIYWSFMTLTSIGYGDFYPTTSAGKVAVMVYAVAALPVVAAATDAVGAAIVAAITPAATAPSATDSKRSSTNKSRGPQHAQGRPKAE